MKPARVRFYFDADILGLGKLLMTQWRRIEALYEVTGPFIKRVTRTRVSTVELD